MIVCIKKLISLVLITWLIIQGSVVIFLITISTLKWFALLLDIGTGIATKDDYLLFFVMNCFYSVMFFFYLTFNKMVKELDSSNKQTY